MTEAAEKNFSLSQINIHHKVSIRIRAARRVDNEVGEREMVDTRCFLVRVRHSNEGMQAMKSALNVFRL